MLISLLHTIDRRYTVQLSWHSAETTCITLRLFNDAFHSKVTKI